MILSFLFNFVLPQDPPRVHTVEAIRLPLVTAQLIVGGLGSGNIMDSKTSHITQISLLVAATTLSMYKYYRDYYKKENAYKHKGLPEKLNYLCELIEFLTVWAIIGNSSYCIQHGDYTNTHAVNIILAVISRFFNAGHTFLAANYAIKQGGAQNRY